MNNALLLWLTLLVVFFLLNTLGARAAVARAAAQASNPPPSAPPGQLAALEAKLAPMMEITGRKSSAKAVQFEGTLRGSAEEMSGKIREAFAGEALTPLLLEGEQNEVRVLLLPTEAVVPAMQPRPNWGLHWLLFVATLATTTWVGALHAGVDLLQQPERFAVGLPYSLGFLLILGAHELGHYFTAKAHGVRVTPPFFVPVPFGLGTFGAFIKIKSITPNRRALFDVAVAGPLAGLVFAIPALLIGLRLSQVIPGNVQPSLVSTGVNIGSSTLMEILARISLGPSVQEGSHLLLHPLAFAGWLGLLVTALNLAPIGQLDGGHMAHALFGSRKAHGLSMVGLAALFLLALFVWPGLMFWAIIVFFIAGTHDTPAADDVTPLGFPRKALGYLTFAVLLLIIVPMPHLLHGAIGLHSPYL